MTDLPIREADQIRRDCSRKVQTVDMHEDLLGILGFLLGEEWSAPRIESVQIWGTHLVLRKAGETDSTLHFGIGAKLTRCIHGIAQAAELDGDEVGYLLGQVVEVTGIK